MSRVNKASSEESRADRIRRSTDRELACIIEAFVALGLGTTEYVDVERRLNWLQQPDTNKEEAND